MAQIYIKGKFRKECVECDTEFFVKHSHLWIKFCGKTCRIENQKGKPSWNKGLIGFRAGEKRVGYFTGKQHTESAKLKISLSLSGEKHYNWNPDREVVKKNLRHDGEYKQWVSKVKYRDRGICRLQNENCMGYKIVHHILGWAQYPEERYNVNNGITLCQYHHPRKKVEEQKMIPVLQKLVLNH